MTRAEFEQASRNHYPGHWLTGEESFVHVAPVLQLKGWNHHGTAANNQLTEPQRVLLMWSDLVGQTVNGGFEQFAGNFEYALAHAHQLIAKLDWPDLWQRFDAAFREQAGDPENPALTGTEWYSYWNDWPVMREQTVRYLALAQTRWRPWNRSKAAAVLRRLPDAVLQGHYIQAVEDGALLGNRPPPEPQRPYSDTFDRWLYLDETRVASIEFIGGYIRRNRDGLVRLTD